VTKPRLGFRLGVHVVEGVPAEGDSPAVLDHPTVQIEISEIAYRYQPPISVSLVALTANRPSTDQVTKTRFV